MNETNLQSHSGSWLFFVKSSFVISILALGIGVVFMPGDLMVKGYFSLGCLFLVSSTLTMAKTLRDQHESDRLINQINEAKTNKIINEFSG